MRDSIWILALVLAGIATGVAVWAGPNLAVAVPAAVLAIVMGVLVGVSRALRPSGPTPVEVEVPETTALVVLESALTSGPLGRAYVLTLLDGLERRLRDRNAPIRPEAEQQRLVRGSDAAFRAFVEKRLTELERES
ncbi:MAG: hypothetical protein WAN87_07470 [Thermoplasmata archaeon]